MNKTFTIAVILSLITSVAPAHKFPLEQGVQDSETLRLEIIENVVNPCYVNIAWSTGVEATMKLGEDAVLAKLKLDGHNEIESTVRSITRTVQGLPHPSSRMAIYMHSVEKCIAGANNDNFGEVVKQDLTTAQPRKSVKQAKINSLQSDSRAERQQIAEEYETLVETPCLIHYAKLTGTARIYGLDEAVRLSKSLADQSVMKSTRNKVINTVQNMGRKSRMAKYQSLLETCKSVRR